MTKNTENPKKSEIEAQILEAKNNQVSIKLNKLKFKSPSDLQNRSKSVKVLIRFVTFKNFYLIS